MKETYNHLIKKWRQLKAVPSADNPLRPKAAILAVTSGAKNPVPPELPAAFGVPTDSPGIWDNRMSTLYSERYWRSSWTNPSKPLPRFSCTVCLTICLYKRNSSVAEDNVFSPGSAELAVDVFELSEKAADILTFSKILGIYMRIMIIKQPLLQKEH